MMYSEILDFHNVDNVDGAQFLGTPLTGPGLDGQVYQQQQQQ